MLPSFFAYWFLLIYSVSKSTKDLSRSNSMAAPQPVIIPPCTLALTSMMYY